MTLHDSCLRCNSDLKYALYSVRVAGFGTASHPKLAMCEGHVLKSVHKHPAQYTNQRCHHTNTCTKHVSDGQRLVQTLHSYLGAIQSMLTVCTQHVHNSKDPCRNYTARRIQNR